MSLESQVESVLDTEEVIRVSFESGVSRVKVWYNSHEFFKDDWPHGSRAGSQEEKESFFQEKLGVDWSLQGLENRGGGDVQIAVFER